MQNHTIVQLQSHAELLFLSHFETCLYLPLVWEILKQLISAVVIMRTGKAYQCARQSGIVRHSLSPNLVNEHKPNLAHDTFELRTVFCLVH